ncbi:MAG: hypothetical protein AB1589_40480 [Cyanobacteriota bacterium]
MYRHGKPYLCTTLLYWDAGLGDRFQIRTGDRTRTSSHEITLQAFDRGIIPSYPLARLTAQSRGSRLASTDDWLMTGTGDRPYFLPGHIFLDASLPAILLEPKAFL